jgi:hypothetical protein
MILVIVMLLKVVYFAASRNQVVENKMLPHMNLRKHEPTLLGGTTQIQIILFARFKALTAVLLKAHLYWIFAFAGLLNIYHSTRCNDPEHVNLQIVHNLKNGRSHLSIFVCVNIQRSRDT